MSLPQVQLGDWVELKKPHPCGADRWRVMRLGSDVVLYSPTCDRRITFTRSKFHKAIKRIIPDAS